LVRISRRDAKRTAESAKKSGKRIGLSFSALSAVLFVSLREIRSIRVSRRGEEFSAESTKKSGKRI
jgi:hypothetical protein